MNRSNPDQSQAATIQIGKQPVKMEPYVFTEQLNFETHSYFDKKICITDQKNSHMLYSGKDLKDLQMQEKKDQIISTLSDHNLETEENVKKHRVITYRSDIDGIRAIAILLVLIYHAFPSKLPGGFIGVDVFFVISGFLITQIIAKEILQRRFSIINFYCRRIKRIYPALILVLSFALWIISKFNQIDLVNFSLETLNAALVFCANIRILVHHQDYFDADIRGNPLLHLWSLGVEEQFYIVWPFLILFTFKCCQKNAMKILVLFTICSFIFSIVAVYQNAKFAFYFPLARFWQMSVGGILGFADFRFRSNLINNALSVVGLLSILVTSFVISEESLFPGFWTLLPTLGCACIIQARNDSFINKHILSSKPLTFIGKISYSLYLWHWPLIVYSRIFYPHGSTSIFSNMYFILGLAFGLSILTYFIAQNPFRKIKTKKVAIVLLILMGVVGVGSVYVDRKVTEEYFSIRDIETVEYLNKYNRQMAPEEEDYVTINGTRYPNFSFNKKRQLPTDFTQIWAPKTKQKYDKFLNNGSLLEKNIDDTSIYGMTEKEFRTSASDGNQFAVANEGQQNIVLLVGDSHMEKISYRFQELFRRSQIKGSLDKFPTIVAIIKRGKQFAEDNPILNITRRLVQKHKPKRIMLAFHWIYPFCKGVQTWVDAPPYCNMERFRSQFPKFIKFLLEMREKGVHVYTNGVDFHFFLYNPGRMYVNNGFIFENMIPFSESVYRKKFHEIYDEVERSLNQAKIDWANPAQNLCWDDVCHVISPKGYAAFLDGDHMGKIFVNNWLTIYDHLVQF